MEPTRRVKIVATLGPATDGREYELVEAGLDVARLNFSHGTQEEHARRCRAIRDAARGLGRSLAVMQDLQGPKIRVGSLAGGGPVELEEGRELVICTDESLVGTADRVGCTYAELAHDVRAGDRILLDDGRIRLTALATRDGEVVTRIEDGGPLGEHKGINLPGVAVSAPAVTDKDKSDMDFGLRELNVDYMALSFVRTADDVASARERIQGLGRNVPVVVKLEKGEAIDNLGAVMDLADAVMVARGDLGVELAPERVPMLQKRIIHQANRRGLPVITATQMLESMIVDETPTRAEATDVANAVWDGSDAVMLSAETAAGRHPVLALSMMDRIVRAAEGADVMPPFGDPEAAAEPQVSPAAAVTHAARVLAADLAASAIVGISRTGQTAELLSRGRGRVPVYAFTSDSDVAQRLALWWGVTPVLRQIDDDLEANISAMERYLTEQRRAMAGETVVITGSHPFVQGVHTNFVRFHVLGQ
jgi:pyruvate kinase